MNEIERDAYIQEEFIQVVIECKDYSFIQDDMISIGNLALFVDYSVKRGRWKDEKETIKTMLFKKQKSELNLYLASKLCIMAKNLKISDNLDYKIKKMKLAFDSSGLDYFDIVLDPYDFPEWFKQISELMGAKSNKERYEVILGEIKATSDKKGIVAKRGNLYALSYFIEHFCQTDDTLPVFIELRRQVQKETLNDFCWYMVSHLLRVYYPEIIREKGQSEAKVLIKKANQYKERYLTRTLTEFDLLSEETQTTILYV